MREPHAHELLICQVARQIVVTLSRFTTVSLPRWRAEPAILPGLLCASLFPAIIGSRCPGALYLSQSLKFRAQAVVRPPLRSHAAFLQMSGQMSGFPRHCAL